MKAWTPSPTTSRNRLTSHIERIHANKVKQNKKKIHKLLIANRGEIAIRIARAAAELGIETVSVYSVDDAHALHLRAANQSYALNGSGAAAYLDIVQIIRAASQTACDAIHPGYGFLSENAEFARACQDSSLTFVGPEPQVLELFGNKARARAFADCCGVPVPRGVDQPVSLDEARDFLAALGPGAAIMVKAIAGGGGRGMRVVLSPDELEEAYTRCRSEAQSAFGQDQVYVESYVRNARHIEVQVAGDGVDVVHFGERDCSIQRRHQKILEIAPCPSLRPAVREKLMQASLAMARNAGYSGLGTFEYLVSDTGLHGEGESEFTFIEANPRIQVEHTVTEEVMGVDLVQIQLQLAQGELLRDIGLSQSSIGAPRGFAIQARVNMDTGGDLTGSGRLEVFDLPSGLGVRIETLGYAGYEPSANFDALLAKIVVHHASANFSSAVDRTYRALSEFQIRGTPHNLELLKNILQHPIFRGGLATTEFMDFHSEELLKAGAGVHPRLFVEERGGATSHQTAEEIKNELVTNGTPVESPLRGVLLEVSVEIGQSISSGQQIALVESMKMEHSISAGQDGTVLSILANVGEVVQAGAPIVAIEVANHDTGLTLLPDGEEGESTKTREDLAEVLRVHELTLDSARPEAVAKRHGQGMRTARENVQDLCDPGTFFEYGALATAAMRSTHSTAELQRISPADGFISGLASVNGDLFPPERSQCLVGAYDYTVFAGTQGHIGHKKHDRLFKLAESARLPLILFTEGGGGRPKDSDNIAGVNLANPTFWHLGRLSGVVPTIGIAAGRCFAGNAAILGMCNIVIATRGSTIGMGGPVMIEGAGFGVVKPEEVGPALMHAQTGNVDILASDEADAVRQAKQCLSYFQGRVNKWDCADQARLRNLIPERRTRAYNIRQVIDVLSDTDSVTEIRSEFGPGAVTALVRIEGRPMGIIANNPARLAGAIGSDEAAKMNFFAKLCDDFNLPILSLCDTPGIMVGPDAEKTRVVRNAAAMFTTGARLKVPFFTIVLRKAYGLGAMAMGGGSFHESSFFSIAWPTAEFGAMGLEGQVRLGFKAELEAIADPKAREQRFKELVDMLYERGKAVHIAPNLSIDDVIDPALSRDWIVKGLLARAPPAAIAPAPHR